MELVNILPFDTLHPYNFPTLLSSCLCKSKRNPSLSPYFKKQLCLLHKENEASFASDQMNRHTNHCHCLIIKYITVVSMEVSVQTIHYTCLFSLNEDEASLYIHSKPS